MAIIRGGATRRSNAARLRIAVATERRYLTQRQPAGLVAALRGTGHEPLILDPEKVQRGVLYGLDVLVARGRSEALLALLDRAESEGVTTVNAREAVAAVVDKAAMARRLEGAGVPCPRTRVGTPGELARGAPPAEYPVIVKPVFGDNARGIRIVRTPEELEKLAWSEPAALAQPLVPSSGMDLKLYVAGADVWAVHKPSPLSPRRDEPARPVPVTPALRALAFRCGHLFGLDLFGVDCIETAAGPVVIEVNDFPNYTGIDDANERLARFVVERALAARLALASGDRP
jgi:ribosomal protein S6--L-glutamate ligase